MSRATEDTNRRMLRARDAMDRSYAEPLDIGRLARIAVVSETHFIRTFRAVFGETPHRYLQRRRIEREHAGRGAGPAEDRLDRVVARCRGQLTGPPRSP